jgi:ribonuclease HI
MSFDIYTDGSCFGNGKKNSQHIGGYGVWIPEYNIELNGGEENTTNNRMELTAIIKTFEYLLNSNIFIKTGMKIFTDSLYVQQGVTDWIHTWKINGWKSSSKTDVKNKDLWIILDDLHSKCKKSYAIQFEWIKAHNGNEHNEKADKLAKLYGLRFSK